VSVELADFLLARIAEDEENCLRYLDVLPAGDMAPLFRRVLADCEAKRRIVEMHKAWPVLVSREPVYEETGSADGFNNIAVRMSQEIAWLTEQEYRAKFGDEPAVAPMLRALAVSYADHPEFREEWRP